MADDEFVPAENELQIHDPYVIPDALELEHEIKRPRWWYAQQLRLAGATWAEIAQALGYQYGHNARRAVTEATKGWKLDAASDVIALDLERLDMLQLVVWRRARQGSLPHIQMVLNIMNQRSKYVPIQRVVDGENVDGSERNSVVEIGGSEEAFLEAAKSAYQSTQHRLPIEGGVVDVVTDENEDVV